MSFRLYRHHGRLVTSGSVSASLRQEAHLLLSLHLEEHENKDHQWQAAKFTERRVFVSAPALHRERNILYECSRPIHDGPDNSKLNADLKERHPFGLCFV